MPESYFSPGAQRATKVQQLFDRIAPRYDLVNDLQSFGLHRLWKRKTVALAQPRPGALALDLCCGTGDLALALAHRGARVAALDFSLPMLTHALRRRLAPAQFIRSDALRIPFASGTFDIVTLGYGLRNLADIHSGLAEMLRVLRPGGRLVILEFGKPDNKLWRAVYFAYLRRLVPLFGGLFCRDPAAYAYILESLEVYPAQREIALRLESLGASESRAIPLLGGVMSINLAVK